ncbi:transglutaminase domain-containing protein [Streptomyces sp. p1417]|uniref:Transglutaminase domain-containing protein n=1 Tax=Streptomyces typhae TaxID=2681492 RepID=A0A6L6WXT3_9ACTN|nr:transglutaminase-like domain-containing protein [Streptomyces typhae]MVO86315.1 transglutaminase domain-containing protein [Streptomyces typhae]
MDSDYLTQSPYSDPGPRLDALLGGAPLPRDPAALAAVVRGLLMHREERGAFGYEVPVDRLHGDAETRYAGEILRIVGERGSTVLTEPREPGARFVATCRDFAVLLCSLLRATGTPARVRAGYGAYFETGLYDNHWVTEYWRSGRGWVLSDVQLLGGSYDVSFDPMDVPRDQFLVAGDAWRACREGRADPDTFTVATVPEIKGLALVRADVVADLAALGGVEVLPWDGWGLMEKDDADVTDDDLALLDTVAALTSAAHLTARPVRPGGVRRLLADARLAVPREIVSHATYLGTRTVTLAAPAGP